MDIGRNVRKCYNSRLKDELGTLLREERNIRYEFDSTSSGRYYTINHSLRNVIIGTQKG